MTLFYRYFPKLIEKGHIFIAQPPLYKVQKGKAIYYAYRDSELEEIKGRLQVEAAASAGKKVKEAALEPESEEQGDVALEEGAMKVGGMTISRYKGLGEMNASQLWETTMDPEKRVLLQVKVEDAEAANEIFDILMGSEVLARKKFIQTHAKNVKNLDI